MNTSTVKLLLLCCLIFQSGCDITFKRKNNGPEMTPAEEKKVKMSQDEKKLTKKALPKQNIKNRDIAIIVSFYADAANAIIRKNIIANTEITKRQAKNLEAGKIISREIQIVPLPLELEKRLPSLSLHIIRVQVDKFVIYMNVKSRQILDIIEI